MADAFPETTGAILVVDSNALVLISVVRLIESLGYHVISVRSSEAALKLASVLNGMIHLLISDMDMPRIPGLLLGWEMKKICPETAVMMMSANGPEASHQVLNYGWSFIEKPLLKQKLSNRIEDALRTRNRSQGYGSQLHA